MLTKSSILRRVCSLRAHDKAACYKNRNFIAALLKWKRFYVLLVRLTFVTPRATVLKTGIFV